MFQSLWGEDGWLACSAVAFERCREFVRVRRVGAGHLSGGDDLLTADVHGIFTAKIGGNFSEGVLHGLFVFGFGENRRSLVDEFRLVENRNGAAIVRNSRGVKRAIVLALGNDGTRAVVPHPRGHL